MTVFTSLFEKRIKWHLNYSVLVEHFRDFGAKRVISTHLSREMLSHASHVPEECAHDGKGAWGARPW